jgi:trk system potassium uptake protein TrkH
MSVTARTAGFNSVSYAHVDNASAFLTILLMVIGGSPGSTAGGIKTTALAVLFSLAVSRILGRRYVSLHGRSIPEGTVQRTVSLTLIAFSLLTISLFFLTFSEAHNSSIGEHHQAFLPLFFEVASALGTVGLSMDVTPTLSMASKILEVFLMFVGRVGPLAFFAAISIRSDQRPRHFRTAHEDLIVG